MGAIQGPLSYKIFYLDQELPKNMRSTLLEQIQANVFEPLNPDDEEIERVGWVPVNSPLSYEFTFDNVYFNHFLNITFRHDKYVIPSKLLRAHVAGAEREYMEEHGKAKLSATEKEDIKDLVQTRLCRQMIPRMKLIDMSWDLNQNRIRFWNHSANTSIMFRDLFMNTFEYTITSANPYNTMVKLGFSDDEVAALERCEAAQYAEGVPGVDF